MPDTTPTLSTAQNARQILEAVARYVWWMQHEDTPCPERNMPDEEQLAFWVGAEECPQHALGQAGDILSALYGEPYAWIASPSSGRLFAVNDDARPGADMWNIDTVHKKWREHQRGEELDVHPLEPILAAWQGRPIEIEPETRKDKRILPRITVTDRPERTRGHLFGRHQEMPVDDPELPLFPDVAPKKRVPILDLVDAAGVPVMARGRGAPLPMRLFVRTLATVKPEDRHLPNAQMALSLRELRDGLFPRGSYRPSKDWPKLHHALMHARDYAIHNGHGRWWPLALRYMPDNPGLDDLIVVDIAYPPRSTSGPPVKLPHMDSLSVDSAPRWRAYIAAHCIAWVPGLTRVRVPHKPLFAWSRNRNAYPIVTLADRRRLAFGAGDTKHRTRAEIDAAFRELPGLVVVSETEVRPRTGEVGWLVLPLAAADALTPATENPRGSTGEN